MSRIGKIPIALPDRVKVEQKNGSLIVEGPKGKLESCFDETLAIKIEAKQVLIERPSDEKKHKELHGLTRALLQNMVLGVSEGFSKKLEIIGVGYNAKVEAKKLVLNVGFSHSVKLDIPLGLECVIPTPLEIEVKGINKQMVGQFAANIRRVRPPEPYKGKGIRYVGEHVLRKVGKTFGKK
jgi:large subunit ribosomal protein L6